MHEHLQESSNLKYKTRENIFENEARCDSRLIITESSSSGSYSASNGRFIMGCLQSHFGNFVEVGGCQQGSGRVERAMDIQ